jgi:metal-responsive CopG/Arc/MetJ family transcriptional regulator
MLTPYVPDMTRKPAPAVRVELRLPGDLAEAIDRWQDAQVGIQGRQDAIRQLLRLALKAEGVTKED